jgi:pimeloyl-ACP methyl ester carboxylesterase
MLEPDRRFYNDLSKQEQDHWVSELRPHPAIAQLTPLTYTAYLHHPVYYLFCENDEALPLDLQKMMVSNTPVDFKTESCSAGHSPFLSQPETVLNFVNKIAV